MARDLEPVRIDPQSRWSMPAPSTGEVVVAAPNNVLRNTYWLLALSMLPAIAGAYGGMALNLATFFRASPIMAPLLLFGLMIGSLFVVAALRNSAWGVAAVFVFTFISGVSLTPILYYAAGLRNGGRLVALAAGMTAAVFFVMATIATVSKRDFSSLGKFLYVGLVLLVIASLANLFFHVPAVAVTISAVAVFIFSLYLLFHVNEVVRGGETNYIMATVKIFLDLLNLFVSLLNLLMIFAGQRD